MNFWWPCTESILIIENEIQGTFFIADNDKAIKDKRFSSLDDANNWVVKNIIAVL